MSNGYGIDIYGTVFYGYSQPADYSVAPFTASQVGYGEIKLSWQSPNTTTWKLLHLVRSTYGYPTVPADGQLLTEIVPGTIQRTYEDAGLTPGTIYYYSMFISIEAPTWSSATTYLTGQLVLLNGQYWQSLSNGNINHTPAVGSAFWVNTQYIPTWFPAGSTATLAIGNQGYGTLLYNRTPQPYKITTSDTFSSNQVDNVALEHYLSLFGFGLDLLKGSYDSFLQLNNVDVVSATNLDILGQQLGISTDYLSTPQQRRQRIKNAAVNYRLKGETQSVHNLIAELAGWDSTVTYGPNLMLNNDQASFVHPGYDMWNANTTYFVGNLIQYNGYNYKNLVQSVGTAQAPTGLATTNTWWQVLRQTLDTQNFLSNADTGGFSTWGITGGVGSFLGVLTGLPHPVDTTINNWNALEWLDTSGGTSTIKSTSKLSTPNYSNVANYSIGANVLFTDGYYYNALISNGPATARGVVTPGLSNQVWQPFYYTTSDTPNVTKDSVPLSQTQFWNATVHYSVGTLVQFFGLTYIAANPNINSAPTGNYYSNLNWQFIQPSEFAYAATMYFGSLGVAGTTVPLFVNFYDNQGNAIPVVSADLSLSMAARFAYDYLDLNNTTEPSMLSNGNPNWTAVPATANLWKSSYGMAYVDPVIAGTTAYTFLFTSFININASAMALTFTTDYIDTTHKAHGILCSYTDSSNFVYVTRKTLYAVVSGVETALASWTRLKDGDRILVEGLNGTTVSVSKYARDGKGTLTTLATVTLTTPNNAKGGLIHKYSASGAV